MINYLIFDGVSCMDFGVYISGSGAYSAPARSREVMSVPGRNGDLIIDNGRYENVKVTYPAFIYKNFALNIQGLRNLLLSRTTYCKLQDTYNPDEYRLAVFDGEFSTDPVEWLEAGEFNLTFDCKPQRFLKEGEKPLEVIGETTINNLESQIAKPLIRAYGVGAIGINNKVINVTAADGYTDIDCDLMDAFKGTENRNAYITGEFPELIPGVNRISLTGITKIEITPRWWRL